jgi:hypothetical protein
MPIQYTTACANRLFINTFTEPFTIAEINEMLAQQRTIWESATQPIHVITNLESMTRLPPNVLSSSLHLIHNAHPMTGKTFIVIPNMLLASMVKALMSAAPKGTLKICTSLQEAVTQAEQMIAQEV